MRKIILFFIVAGTMLYGTPPAPTLAINNVKVDGGFVPREDHADQEIAALQNQLGRLEHERGVNVRQIQDIRQAVEQVRTKVTHYKAAAGQFASLRLQCRQLEDNYTRNGGLTLKSNQRRIARCNQDIRIYQQRFERYKREAHRLLIWSERAVKEADGIQAYIPVLTQQIQTIRSEIEYVRIDVNTQVLKERQ